MKRTPRNYRGTASPTKQLVPLLQNFLETLAPKEQREKQAIFNAWDVIIGKNLRNFTRPVSFHEGTLTVFVKTHTLYAFLCTHEKPRLLQEMQKKIKKPMIKTLRFRIG